MNRREALKRLIDKKFNGKQADFARAIDRSPSLVWQCLSGHRPIGEKLARAIEGKLRLENGWLDNPPSESFELENPKASRAQVAAGALMGRRADDRNINTREGPQVRGLVPLISSVQAGEWCEMVNSFEASDADYWLPCPVKHGPHTFCLVVEGESMKNPYSKPSYDPGDIIFVDPEVTPTSGSRVVVRLESQEKATFKQYVEEDGQHMLKALNPDWKPRYVPLSERAAVCGVVIGKWVPE